MPERIVRPAELRRALEGGEYVEIGAWVRRRRRRRVLVACGGLLLLALAGGVYASLWARSRERVPDRFAVRLRCATCGHEQDADAGYQQDFPWTCPRCGEKALRVLWACRACGHLFLPASDETPACPKCASQRVGTAARGSAEGG